MKRITNIFTHSFPLRLSLVMLGLVTLLFALAFWSNSRSARKYVHREAIERAQLSLDNTILRINNVLQSVELTIHNLAWLIPDNLDYPEDLYSMTDQIVSSNNFISGSAIAFEPYYYEEYGQFYAPYSCREGDNIVSKQLGTTDYNYHYMDWYQIPRLLDEPYWSEPYYDEGGGNIIMTTYSYPIYDQDGEMIAIFTADLSLEWFAEQVNSIKLYPNSYSMMIGRGGSFLVHDNSNNILNETIFASARAMNDSNLMAMAHNMVDGNSGVGEFERYGETFYLSYAPVEATGWSVAVACPHADIFSGVDSVGKYSLIVGLAGMMLMTLICFFTIRRMTRPLTKITHAAMDIAHGNLAIELPNVKGHDEIRVLHDSFANMQQSLLKYIDELKSTTANTERIESELRIARSIQLGMVPKVFPPFPEREDIDIYARLLPAREVGGDLYDFFIEKDELRFIIGDVSGKGVPASLLMAVTCRLFRTIAMNVSTPEGIVATLNDALSESNDSNMFCTAFVGILDLKSGLLRYCNAGHNPPVILLPDGSVDMLTVTPNLALGVWEGFDFKGESYQMQRGSSLFTYTDGVTEAENSNKELYGDQRLVDILRQQRQSSPSDIVKSLLDDITLHVKDADQSDDITVLCCTMTSLPEEGDYHNIVLHNQIDEIGRMAAFLDEICEGLNLSVEETFNIHLALEEAVSNVIMYAFPKEEDHEITLSVRYTNDRLIFKIIDSGKEFDPTLQPNVDVTLSLEERPIGGLGIFLIRNIMQAVEYSRVDNQNILTMVKVIGQK